MEKMEGFLIGLSTGFLLACMVKHQYDKDDPSRDHVPGAHSRGGDRATRVHEPVEDARSRRTDPVPVIA
jgi:hypothetical protein